MMLIVLSFCLHTIIKNNYPIFYKHYYREVFWITLESAITIVFLTYSVVEIKILKMFSIIMTGTSLGMVVAEIFRDLTRPDLFSVIGFSIGILIMIIYCIWKKINIEKCLVSI